MINILSVRARNNIQVHGAAGKVLKAQIRRGKFALVFFENAAGAKKAIESFNGKTALINRGEKALKEGERFQIFKVVQEGSSSNPLKFWGARLQPAGELQIAKIDGGSVVGNILTADFNRDGDFVLKPIASAPSATAATPAKGKPSVFD